MWDFIFRMTISENDKELFWKKHYLIVDNFVEDKICDWIRIEIQEAMAKNKHFDRYTENFMKYQELQTNLIPKIRVLQNQVIKQKLSIYEVLMEKTSEVKFSRGGYSDINSRAQIYPHGSYLRPHKDGNDEEGYLSFSVALNNRTGGGGFLKVGKDTVDCIKGRCTIMDANAVQHEVTNVKDYTRYNLITFIR